MPDQPARTLAGIDISVIDDATVTVASLHADAASHPVQITATTVSELYAGAAGAEVDRLLTGVAELAGEDVLVQGQSAFADAAAVLRCLSERAADAQPDVAQRCEQLAADLTREAAALAAAADATTAARR